MQAKPTQRKHSHEGVERLHQKRCASIEWVHKPECKSSSGGTCTCKQRRRSTGRKCNCKPTWRAWVWSRRDEQKIRKTFPTLAAAKAWRSDAGSAVRKGTLHAPSKDTLRVVAEGWLSGAEDGTIRGRNGRPYRPSVLREYSRALRQRVLDEFGGARLSEITRLDLQDYADRLVSEGLDPSTVRNTLMPLRAICRRALSRGDIAVNPTLGLELPAPQSKRDRIASPTEASDLLAALAGKDRPLWATAFYAGLRRGELQALLWENVDLATGRIRVERSYDDKAGIVTEPKSAAGRRTVPIATVLRDVLIEHKMATGRESGLVFGADGVRRFTPSNVTRRAHTAWKNENKKRAEANLPVLEPINLHECRHTFASLMIAAGVNAKALSSYMGHSGIAITFDRYGHLMPGNEDEAAELLDRYLTLADTKARVAQIEVQP